MDTNRYMKKFILEMEIFNLTNISKFYGFTNLINDFRTLQCFLSYINQSLIIPPFVCLKHVL